MDERVAELAAEGYNEFKIASILGFRVPTVKEILEKPVIKALVETLKARPLPEVKSSRYSRIEDMALAEIEQRIQAEDTPVLLKILDTAIKRREIEDRTKVPVPGTTIVKQTIVNIALPNRLIPVQDTTLTLNNQSEIVAVGGRSFAPLPTEQLPDIFAAVEAKQGLDLARKVMEHVNPEDF